MKKIIFLLSSLLLIIKNFTAFRIKKLRQDDRVTVIPDEIKYDDNQQSSEDSRYIYDMNKYHYKLEANKISNYDNAVKHNGEYYYKSPSPYYGPYNTYQRIPQVEEDVKFNTPVTIGETDDFKSPDDLKREMEDDLRQLSKLMLFSSLPKHNPQVSKFSVKHNEPLAYYDPTVKDKEERIDQLRRRILELRKMLNIPSNDVHLYVEVNNSTYPKHPYDMLNHLQESSYSYHHANIKDDLEGLNIFSKDNDKENKKNEEKPTDNKQITQIVHEPNEKSNTEGEIDSSYMDTNISQKAKQPEINSENFNKDTKDMEHHDSDIKDNDQDDDIESINNFI